MKIITNILKKYKNIVPIIMLTFCILGVAIFYVFPFLLSFVYALMNNSIRRNFVGIQNFIQLFSNLYFMNGLRNTLIFIGISIPINMVLSLGTSLIVNKLSRFGRWLSLVFLIPLVIPSATTAFFWENVFGENGMLNKFLLLLDIKGMDWFQSKYGLLVMVVIFLWKNNGYNMALYISGLNNIPKEYYECASMEGAGRIWTFKALTLRYLTPTSFLVLIMSFVNSFKVFKEIYIITGQYPSDHLYLLQHYMNNMFLSLNYSKLVSAVYVLTIGIIIFVAFIFCLERKVSEKLYT